MELHVDREMPDVQAGFCKSRVTIHQIANVRWLMEWAREYNEEIYMCYIDCSKAFDCVDHAVLWTTLLSCLYDGQEASVRTEVWEINSFQIGKGVRQGWILSLALFNFYADGVIRRAGLDETEDWVRHGGYTINNLRYADDLTLLAGSQDSLCRILRALKSAGEKVGLYLNVKKITILSTATLNSFDVDGAEVEGREALL